MRLLVDACLSPSVATGLRDAKHHVVLVGETDLLHAADEAILVRYGDDDRVVVSADADLGALLAGSGAAAPSVVLVPSPDDLPPVRKVTLLAASRPSVAANLEASAIVVIDRRSVRVRALPIERSS